MHAYIPPGQAEEKQPEEEKGALKLFLSLPDIPDSYQTEMATLTSKKEETGADQTDALSPLQAPTPLFKHAHAVHTRVHACIHTSIQTCSRTPAGAPPYLQEGSAQRATACAAGHRTLLVGACRKPLLSMRTCMQCMHTYMRTGGVHGSRKPVLGRQPRPRPTSFLPYSFCDSLNTHPPGGCMPQACFGLSTLPMPIGCWHSYRHCLCCLALPTRLWGLRLARLPRASFSW